MEAGEFGGDGVLVVLFFREIRVGDEPRRPPFPCVCLLLSCVVNVYCLFRCSRSFTTPALYTNSPPPSPTHPQPPSPQSNYASTSPLPSPPPTSSEPSSSSSETPSEHPLKTSKYSLRYSTTSPLPPITTPTLSTLHFSPSGTLYDSTSTPIGTWSFPPPGNSVTWSITLPSGSTYNYYATFYSNFIGGCPKMVKGVVTRSHEKGVGRWFKPVVATFEARGISEDDGGECGCD